MSACVQVTLLYLKTTLTCKSSDAGKSDMPNQSHKTFLLSEKVEEAKGKRKGKEKKHMQNL